MKRIFAFVFVLIVSALSASVVFSVPSEESVPQETQQIACPTCGGTGSLRWTTPWGTTELITCGYCKGTGRAWATLSFEGNRVAYYAECSHKKDGCKCKLFKRARTGSTKCTCGHSQSSHVKRYL